MNKANQNVFITNNLKETKELARSFVKKLKKRNLIALYGNLGSGKTTFVQNLAKEFGIKKRIISPTFVIIRSYKIGNKYQSLNIRHLYHIDLYRVEDKESLNGLGIKDVLNNPQNIVAIEWAEKMKNLLPKERWDIKFEDMGGNIRKITFDHKL